MLRLVPSPSTTPQPSDVNTSHLELLLFSLGRATITNSGESGTLSYRGVVNNTWMIAKHLLDYMTFHGNSIKAKAYTQKLEFLYQRLDKVMLELCCLAESPSKDQVALILDQVGIQDFKFFEKGRDQAAFTLDYLLN
ncbi:hypothetical protein [Pseudobacteriovorax antillogorgiicola]|uniref:Uncharacterized protein n=1 Tax=Pseudobacteriovorax antillogorgiicola TaxID=1513793 RepID=A0A1Y6BZ26_9BACT|nr:hypothetical protein [Pseudobacteriovorax antillogorgiicola]TCS53138.1 hypothetical protein EDD56_108189 [Pseudobacteriovorax antillogorgiicola]SMF25297.1 hypothetical protein SAMN06296036_10857 [Pseudobacteriovorax antillogorgiicola]